MKNINVTLDAAVGPTGKDQGLVWVVSFQMKVGKRWQSMHHGHVVYKKATTDYWNLRDDVKKQPKLYRNVEINCVFVE